MKLIEFDFKRAAILAGKVALGAAIGAASGCALTWFADNRLALDFENYAVSLTKCTGIGVVIGAGFQIFRLWLLAEPEPERNFPARPVFEVYAKTRKVGHLVRTRGTSPLTSSGSAIIEHFPRQRHRNAPSLRK
jgi:hypothetical protein